MRGELTTPLTHGAPQTHRPRELHLVLTGAPAGGKSTFLPRLQRLLEAAGFRVVVVPEAATAYFMSRGRNGKPLDLSSQTPTQITVIQSRIHVQQLRNEATAREMASDAAEDGDDVVVNFDRAAPDGQAFADAGCWAKLVNSAPVDPLQYDLVLELHSTALLSDRNVYEFGPSAENTARQHNREDAAALGDKFKEAYADHPFFHRIEAEPDIKVKFMNAVSALVDHLPAGMRARLGGRTISEICDGQDWPADAEAEAPQRTANEDTEDWLFFAVLREDHTKTTHASPRHKLTSKTRTEKWRPKFY